MFITATDVNYLHLTKIWINSLKRVGRISESEIAIAVYGDKDARRAMSSHMKRLYPRLTVVQVDLQDKAFKVLDTFKINRQYLVSDYIRVWIARHFPRYIWMDADILLNRPIRGLLGTLASTDRLMLAPDVSLNPHRGKAVERRFSKDGQDFLQMYEILYKVVYRETPRRIVDRQRYPVVLNCGVIVADRSYEEEWREVLQSLVAFAPKHEVVTNYVYKSLHIGQAVWNLLFLKSGGEVLDRAYNSFHFQTNSNPIATHYVGDGKDKMLREALIRRLI